MCYPAFANICLHYWVTKYDMKIDSSQEDSKQQNQKEWRKVFISQALRKI